jgi:hypothetical protein
MFMYLFFILFYTLPAMPTNPYHPFPPPTKGMLSPSDYILQHMANIMRPVMDLGDTCYWDRAFRRTVPTIETFERLIGEMYTFRVLSGDRACRGLAKRIGMNETLLRYKTFFGSEVFILSMFIILGLYISVFYLFFSIIRSFHFKG